MQCHRDFFQPETASLIQLKSAGIRTLGGYYHPFFAAAVVAHGRLDERASDPLPPERLADSDQVNLRIAILAVEAADVPSIAGLGGCNEKQVCASTQVVRDPTRVQMVRSRPKT